MLGTVVPFICKASTLEGEAVRSSRLSYGYMNEIVSTLPSQTNKQKIKTLAVLDSVINRGKPRPSPHHLAS